MRKVFIIFAILAALAATSQERKFGIIGGASNPTLTEGVLNSVNFQFGLTPHVGVFYEMKLANKIHFRPRLSFMTQGTQIALSNSFGYQYYDYRLNYLNIPLDLKFWNKVYLVVGPQAGYMITSNIPDSDIKSRVDFGANLGLGIRFRNAFIELGIYQGFIPVIDEGSGVYRNTYNNAAARFSAGWYIL